MPAAGGLQLTVSLLQGDEAVLTQQAAALGLLLPRLSPLYREHSPRPGWLLGFAALAPAEIASACDKLVNLLAQQASG